ncbi:hypothetical protein GQ37_002750 [Janthinobacterium sp. BJB1]|nr:hypothetical protein GQ37_002750 [Janthinobacterium sp. BJB1]
MTRQSDDSFVIAVFHGNFGIFHGARFKEPILGLGIDGRHLVRFDFTNEIRNMRIEEGQTLVTRQDFVVWHFAGE